MIIHLLLLLFGFFLLIKGSDFFVESSSRLAKSFGVSKFIIGLTLVAFGTSVPELASSVVAAIQGHPDIIIGNIIGSNLANIGLVIGITALFITLKANKELLERDSYIILLVSVIFFIFAVNKEISKIESIILLLLYVVYIMFLFKTRKKEVSSKFQKFLNYFVGFEYLTSIKNMTVKHVIKKRNLNSLPMAKKKIYTAFKKGMAKESLIFILSLITIIYGAKYLITEIIWFSNFFSVPKQLLALTLIAIGTSLPELGVSISAARKGYWDMIIGNIAGSNITNILLIGGISGLITNLPLDITTVSYTIPFMIFLSAVLMYLMRRRDKGVRHMDGVLLVSLYLIFIASIIFMNIF